jgi:hypothetical protein
VAGVPLCGCAGLKRIQIDIDLTRRPDVAHFKAVGLEAVFHEPDFFDADRFLFFAGDDEA